MDINKKIVEIEDSFRNGNIDNRIGFLRGDFETFEEMMIESFDLNVFFDVDSENFSSDEIDDNIQKLRKVLFEECVNRLRKELVLE